LRSLALVLALLAGLVLAAPASAVAIGEPLEFETEEQREQYYSLVRQLRCTVCQSETIYESPSDFSADMRQRVYEMTINGRSKDEIIKFMTERYGDYVRYKPPMQLNTALLWVSPFLLLVVGVITWLQVVRRRRQLAKRGDLTESERRALERFRRGY
jgi:cytochrome c-type biogenesis protein CcmH